MQNVFLHTRRCSVYTLCLCTAELGANAEVYESDDITDEYC
jgi:hypothetical protein